MNKKEAGAASVSESKMKTLTNCTPTEFFIQTNKIRKAVEKWVTVTELMKIRQIKPDIKEIPIDVSAEDRERIVEENRQAIHEQGLKNLSAMLDSMLEKHPKETLEVLALTCFIDPKNVDNYPITVYLKAINDIISNKEVLDFFASLAQLVNRSGLTD